MRAFPYIRHATERFRNAAQDLLCDTRWWKSSAVGVAYWATNNFVLLYLGVKYLPLDSTMVKLMVSIAMSPIGFLIDSFLWRDRGTRLKTRGGRWPIFKLSFFCINYSAFFVVVRLLGISYLLAPILLSPTISILAYKVRDKQVFIPQPKIPRSAPFPAKANTT